MEEKKQIIKLLSLTYLLAKGPTIIFAPVSNLSYNVDKANQWKVVVFFIWLSFKPGICNLQSISYVWPWTASSAAPQDNKTMPKNEVCYFYTLNILYIFYMRPKIIPLHSVRPRQAKGQIPMS